MNTATAFTALTVDSIVPMDYGIEGTMIRLTIPAEAPAMSYAHEVSGNVYETRSLILWLVDSREHAGFHAVTLLGNYTGLGALVEVEGWDDSVSAADALEGSEYLAAQGLAFTLEGSEASMLPY